MEAAHKKTMIVIGATGDGKSTMCNVVAGKDPNDKGFPVYPGMKSGTIETTNKVVKWRGQGFEMNLIDTPGLSDSHSQDFKNVHGMMEELKKHKIVDAFVLLINATEMTSFSTQFKNMIVIFKMCYGKEFLEKNTIIGVTKWSYSENEIRLREKKKLDEESAKKHINDAMKDITRHELPNMELKVVFIDAFYNNSNTESSFYERSKFEAGMKELEHFVTEADAYKCNHVLFEDHRLLMEKIKEDLTDRDEIIKEKEREIEAKNDREKQLSEDIQRLKDRKLYSKYFQRGDTKVSRLEEKETELKAKNEKIQRLKKDLEEKEKELKAKNEEIQRLKHQRDTEVSRWAPNEGARPSKMFSCYLPVYHCAKAILNAK